MTGAGLRVQVCETTSDVGVPAFICKTSEGGLDDPQRQPVSAGYGCHASRSVALLRALTEAVQSRLTLIAGSRDDIRRDQYRLPVDHTQTGTDCSWTDSGFSGRSFLQVPTREAETFDEDLSWLLESLRSVGIRRVVVVDLTRPELGVPVVRVIIPGMEVAVVEPPGELALGLRALAVQARAVIAGCV
jgi:ribosomal protein S12 methylthiotransferase accessory factor